MGIRGIGVASVAKGLKSLAAQRIPRDLKPLGSPTLRTPPAVLKYLFGSPEQVALRDALGRARQAGLNAAEMQELESAIRLHPGLPKVEDELKIIRKILNGSDPASGLRAYLQLRPFRSDFPSRIEPYMARAIAVAVANKEMPLHMTPSVAMTLAICLPPVFNRLQTAAFFIGAGAGMPPTSLQATVVSIIARRLGDLTSGDLEHRKKVGDEIIQEASYHKRGLPLPSSRTPPDEDLYDFKYAYPDWIDDAFRE